MEWITDPTIWAGLATLVVLEIVLGIDNLVFIAILAEKLPRHLSDKARLVGLSFALVMRICLLVLTGWLVTLKTPLFTLFEISFNGRQLIMLVGGIFLLFKATMELNDRLEGNAQEGSKQRKTSHFWTVVAQIVILDAVFSLDAVITAVGMVEHIPVMIAAVCIAMSLMMLASKPLTIFVNAHPTIVILCLSFLLMIGFSLVAEGFDFIIPKGYLYAAIGFSIIIEIFNQIGSYNRRRFLTRDKTLRQRTAEAVLHILRGDVEDEELDSHSADLIADAGKQESVFNQQELSMIERVLGLAQRSVSSIMTSRLDIDQINLDSDRQDLINAIEENQHTRLIVTDNDANNEPIGIIYVNDLLKKVFNNEISTIKSLIKQPLIFPETVSLLVALEQFKAAKTHFAFVVDEFGSTQGVVSVTDIMETIAGELPTEEEDVDSRHDIQCLDDGSYLANGYIPLEELVRYIDIPLDDKRDYHTLAGLLMEKTQHIPTVGEKIVISPYLFDVIDVESHRIVKVQIYHQPLAHHNDNLSCRE
jgi:CBS domain containing-hemolysin-like protein